MPAPPEEWTIGERVAFHRRRRGLTQDVLAGMVGRTTSWIEKIENGRAALDRVSVIQDLAVVLDVRVADLLPDPAPSPTPAPRLRLDYAAINPRLVEQDRVASAEELSNLVADVWSAYQDSRFGYCVTRLNAALPLAYAATRGPASTAHAQRCLALLYHAAASVLVKLGSPDDAHLCAERGDIAAQHSEDPITMLSLQRALAHSLLSKGRHQDAVTVVRDGIINAPEPRTPAELSVTGTLMLVGATAAARANERGESAAFLRHAGRLADALEGDRNEVWTSFGPTNVAIHQVRVAADLGDHTNAIELGSALDVAPLGRERRVRHQLELARALSRVGRLDDSLATLLAAERGAPEQVRQHFLTAQLVQSALRSCRARPNADLVALARRLGHAS